MLEKLRKFLKKYRISQAELARKANMEPTYMNRIITGRLKTSEYNMKRVKIALNKFEDLNKTEIEGIFE